MISSNLSFLIRIDFREEDNIGFHKRKETTNFGGSQSGKRSTFFAFPEEISLVFKFNIDVSLYIQNLDVSLYIHLDICKKKIQSIILYFKSKTWNLAFLHFSWVWLCTLLWNLFYFTIICLYRTFLESRIGTKKRHLSNFFARIL